MINSTSHYKAMIDKDFSEYLKNFKCKFKEILKNIQGNYICIIVRKILIFQDLKFKYDF